MFLNETSLFRCQFWLEGTGTSAELLQLVSSGDYKWAAQSAIPYETKFTQFESWNHVRRLR